MTWHLITGEYPPQPGGVSDYTQLLATGLVARGECVHVWCPGETAAPSKEQGVEVHRICGEFTLSNLWTLGNGLKRFPPPRRILVQYAPNAFGLRGCNLPFCLWLLWRRWVKRDDVRVMFHEPFYYFARQSLRRNALAMIQRVMATLLLTASNPVYVSIPAWETLLKPWAWFGRRRFVWLPIPATISVVQDDCAVASLRSHWLNKLGVRQLAGHFSSYPENISTLLKPLIKQLLEEHPELGILCLGRHSDRFAQGLSKDLTDPHKRVTGLGQLSERDISLHLQACDLMVQPFPDGASSRRTSLMACLAHGIPTVTNTGDLSELVWQDFPGRLARNAEVVELMAVARDMLREGRASPGSKPSLQEFCADHFGIQLTLDTLCLESGRT